MDLTREAAQAARRREEEAGDAPAQSAWVSRAGRRGFCKLSSPVETPAALRPGPRLPFPGRSVPFP